MDHKSYRPYGGKSGGGWLFLIAALVFLAAVVMYFFAPFHLQKFAAFPAAFGLLLLLFALSTCLPEKGGKIMRRVLWLLALAAVVAFAALEAVIITGARTEIHDTPDVVVVLGAQVKPEGPSVLLADRLNTAYDYLIDHPDLPVVVTGGQGPDEPTTEALAMRDYLVDKGLDSQRIWLEDQAHNTSENLSYTRALLIEKGLDPDSTHLLVVSNGFHLARVRMLAGRQGLDISTLAAPSSHRPSKIQSYIREAPALIKSWLLDR